MGPPVSFRLYGHIKKYRNFPQYIAYEAEEDGEIIEVQWSIYGLLISW
jgi:hypothetical protein